MNCRGICERLKVHGTYLSGKKRCAVCCINIKWDGLWCPCCNMRLKAKPLAKKDKENLYRIIGQPKRY